MHLYCQSGTLVCKGVVTNKDILECHTQWPKLLENLLTDNAPIKLENVKKGAYHYKKIGETYTDSHKIWHRSIPEPDDEPHFEASILFGGPDGTSTVYVGDYLYEPNNEDLNNHISQKFEWVVSKHPKHAAKNRAMGFLYFSGGDTGADIQYLENDAKEIVALYLP